MAEDAKVESKEAKAPADAAPADAAAKTGRRKKPLFLGGGAVLVLGLAYLAATMAVPSKHESRRFNGPFVVPLFEDKVHSNLADEGHKRFLQMNMNVVYVAYEEAYVVARVADPLYRPFVTDAVLKVNMTKNTKQVFDKVSLGVYLEEIREALDPILFPVHVGAGKKPTDPDHHSGIGPGLSIHESTLRVPYDEHVLHVDAPAKHVRIDDGPEISFEGNESDLEVKDAEGRVLYVDVSAIHPDFVGELHVGIQGRVKQILCQDFLVQ